MLCLLRDPLALTPLIHGRVGKLMNPMVEIEKLAGGPSKIEHALRPGQLDKKHASMLVTYPLELIPFAPLGGPGKSPFINASIKGFTPSQLFRAPVQFTSVEPAAGFYWPSVSELNDELLSFPRVSGGEQEDVSTPLGNRIDSDHTAVLFPSLALRSFHVLR